MGNKPQNLHSVDIYRAIAQQTSLTNSQVKECFAAYRNIIEQIADSATRPLNYSMPIPHIGTIKFVRKYQDPNRKLTGAIKHVDISKTKPKEQYDKLIITPHSSLNIKVKELSYARFIQSKEKQQIGSKD